MYCTIRFDSIKYFNKFILQNTMVVVAADFLFGGKQTKGVRGSYKLYYVFWFFKGMNF